MAFENRGTGLVGMEAGADLSAQQFKFVTVDATGVVLAGAGEIAVGVLQDKPVAGEAVTVYGPGSVSKVKVGAAVAMGAEVTPDASSRAVTSALNDYVAGKALEAATAVDQIISVFLFNPGRTD